VATVSGLILTGGVFMVLTVSERANQRKFALTEGHRKEQFQLLQSEAVERESAGVRPGSILVTVRDYNTMVHLRWILGRVNSAEQDVVCMTARLSWLSSGASELTSEQLFSDYEQTLFTPAVAIAEKFGKRISMLVVPAQDVWSSRLRPPRFSTQRSFVFQNCCDGHRDDDSQRDFEKTVSGRDPGGMHGTDQHHDGDGHAG
jgi:hypothetical protein